MTTPPHPQPPSDPTQPPLPAPTARQPRRGPSDTLLFMTTISALDGTVFLLAASGALSSLGGAVAAGLTVIAGAGAWLSAHTLYGRRRDWRRFATTAGLAGSATLLAAGLGAALGHLPLAWLPRAGGLALLLVALEVGGLSLPRIGRLPLPFLLIALALPLEVLRHWTP